MSNFPYENQLVAIIYSINNFILLRQSLYARSDAKNNRRFWRLSKYAPIRRGPRCSLDVSLDCFVAFSTPGNDKRANDA